MQENQPALFAECLIRAGSVQLAIDLETFKSSSDEADKILLELTTKSLFSITNHKSQPASRILQCNFPFKLWPNKTSLLAYPSRTQILLKLVAEKSPKLSTSPLQIFNPHADISKLYKISSLQSECKFCGALLSNPLRDFQVLPLPSQNWREMVEFWICHKNHIKPSLSQPISARKNCILEGPNLLIFSKEDILFQNFYVSTHQNSISTHHSDKFKAQISCKRCNSMLGHIRLKPPFTSHPEALPANILHFELMKHAVLIPDPEIQTMP
eukprot:Sdes_comp9521_c0_seq1m990